MPVAVRVALAFVPMAGVRVGVASVPMAGVRVPVVIALVVAPVACVRVVRTVVVLVVGGSGGTTVRIISSHAFFMAMRMIVI